MNAQGEVVDIGALSAKIEDSNLGVRDTTVESGLGIRLVKLLDLLKCQALKTEVAFYSNIWESACDIL
jgi:hypothetical protein